MRGSAVLVAVGALVGGVALSPLGATASPAARPALQTGMHASPIGELSSAGDLNGDGHPDVLDTRSVTSGSTNTFGVTARDGRSGKVLWAKSFPNGDGYSDSVLTAKIGAKAKPGVIVMASSESFVASTETIALGFTALDGKTGKTVWSKAFSGTESGSNRVTVPSFIGAVHDVKGRATDFLLTLQTHGGDNSDQTLPFILSGVDGHTHASGSSFVAAGGVGYPAVTISPDLDGDGLTDMVAVVLGPSGGIVAERAKDGHHLWTNSTLPLDAESGIVAVGRFAQHKTGSLILESGSSAGPRPLRLIDGRTGHAKWTRTASEVYILGSAGAHHAPALGFETFTDTSTATTVAMTVTFIAVSATNHKIYTGHATSSVKRVSGATGSGFGTGFGPFGDTQPDGSADERPYLDVSSESPTTTNEHLLTGVVDGRTGSYRDVPFDVAAAGSLESGAGTDLLEQTLHKGKASVTGYDGTSGKKFFHRSIAGQKNVDGLVIVGLRASGNSCSDIGYSTVTTARHHGSSGVLSARGARLWTVSYSETQATGGKLKHFKKPAHFCV